VTLVGIAGVGKTRIAQEILAREADKPGNGVAWVSLQPLNEAQHIPSAIALALGLALPEGPTDLRHCARRSSERRYC